jgi:hypothetical protein
MDGSYHRAKAAAYSSKAARHAARASAHRSRFGGAVFKCLWCKEILWSQTGVASGPAFFALL